MTEIQFAGSFLLDIGSNCRPEQFVHSHLAALPAQHQIYCETCSERAFQDAELRKGFEGKLE